MLACVDVDYRATEVVAACVAFHDWPDASPAKELALDTPGPAAEYQPGELYRRELPHLLAVLAKLDVAPRAVVIDGHVWLGPDRPGLGAHLHTALGGGVAVVGVAKRPFHGATIAIAVLRGTSRHPLFVTAAGIDPALAAARVRAMHGPHRIPTLLKRVDRLCRDHVTD